MIKFKIGNYNFLVQLHTIPAYYQWWLENAIFIDTEGLKNTGTSIYIGVEQQNKVEMSVIAFNTDPIDGNFFNPELLFIPETEILFIGAGKKALAYNLQTNLKVLDENLTAGFWYWGRHNDLVILVEEVEIGIYDINGNFRWSLNTEPPWSYGIKDDILLLDIMGTITKHELLSGNKIEV